MVELSGENMQTVAELRERYSDPSFYDCLALVLARVEQCELLSGDGDLRRAAIREGVQVRGTIWIVERLIIDQIITPEKARRAYERMQEAGSRLPWNDAYRRLEQFQ
ncbi:hypothetical protein [Photobacterium damselae]|uniref:hypothetical protein n=1 Tax=Photobacterium damselae TaxID=38293 RepID=UPI0022AACEE1|nr:hypothetical protein [Photobacterium damselae]